MTYRQIWEEGAAKGLWPKSTGLLIIIIHIFLNLRAMFFFYYYYYPNSH